MTETTMPTKCPRCPFVTPPVVCTTCPHNEETVVVPVEALLGHRFRNKQYLLRALTHRSLAQDAPSYERLEFLGDKILGMIVAQMLYRQFPDADEGELSARLSSLVNRNFLARWMQDLQIGAYIQMSTECYDNDMRQNITILADVAEALIAAIYLDGGMAAAEMFIVGHIGEDVKQCPLQKDAKSRLQNWCQARGFSLPEYRQISQSGPPHAPFFVFSVSTSCGRDAQGQGSSKREAMHRAAENYWQQHIQDSSDADEANG